MTRKRLLYIPILLLFAFSMSALVLHYANVGKVQARFFRDAKLPFGYTNARAYSLSPEAAEAGIRTGDRIERINGRLLEGEIVFDEEMAKLRAGEPLAKNAMPTNPQSAIRNRLLVALMAAPRSPDAVPAFAG